MSLLLIVPFVVAVAPVEAVEVLTEVNGGWQATFVVHADADDVLAVVGDQERYAKQLFDKVKTIKVVSRGKDGTSQVEYVVDGGMSDLKYTTANKLTKTSGGGGTTTWQRISGDIDLVEGQWTIKPHAEPGWSDIVYFTKVAMGPGFMQGFVRDGVRDNTKGIAARLRKVMAKLPKKEAPTTTTEPTTPPTPTPTTPTTPVPTIG